MSPVPVTVNSPPRSVSPASAPGRRADDRRAAPARRPVAGRCDLVERGRGRAVRLAAHVQPPNVRLELDVFRRGDEHAGLDGRSPRSSWTSPTSVQRSPSGDAAPVSVFPLRDSRSHWSVRVGPAMSCGEVVLHAHAVVAGEQHRRVRRAELGALLDDHAGLGPRFGVLGESAATRAVMRAVAGERAVHEVNASSTGVPSGPVGGVWPAQLSPFGPAQLKLAAGGAEQSDEDGQRDRDEHADDPAADGAELGPLGVNQVSLIDCPPGTPRPRGSAPCRPPPAGAVGGDLGERHVALVEQADDALGWRARRR